MMDLNRIFALTFFSFLLYSCADYNNSQLNKKSNKIYYSSSGFALIYDETLYTNKIVNKKIKNDEMIIMHKILKRNTPVKLINPENGNTLETKIFATSKYPNIFNSVVNKKLANFLDLDINDPYIEIIETKKNKKFIAKEGSIFEEEKNVADKAPVNEVKMDDLSKNEPEIKKKEVKKKFVLVISDFYYLVSANNLKNELKKKMKINNIFVKKIANNKYRLLVGPFKNFNTLKTSYISLNNLGFEDLNIYKE